MSSISDKLSYALETKEQIKQAIIDKGVPVADTDPFRSYPQKIRSIPSEEPSKPSTGIILLSATILPPKFKLLELVEE